MHSKIKTITNPQIDYLKNQFHNTLNEIRKQKLDTKK